MKDNEVKDLNQIADEGDFVQLQIGFKECEKSHFNEEWNNGRPSVKLGTMPGIKGPCGVKWLKSILISELLKKDGKYCKGALDAKWASYPDFGIVALAVAFDDGEKFVIGVLEYNVVHPVRP